MSAVARRYYVRGRDAIAKSDWTTALEALAAAVELVPTFVAARCAYAIALAQSGDCPRAAQNLRAGLARTSLPSEQASLWGTLGDVLVRGGDFLGAEDAYKQCGSVPNNDARSASGLARVYAKLGRYKDAFTQLHRAAADESAR